MTLVQLFRSLVSSVQLIQLVTMAELSNLPVCGARVPIDTPLAEGRSHVAKKKRNRIPKQRTKKRKNEHWSQFLLVSPVLMVQLV